MEVKDVDTMVIVRPVASRPSRSRFMSLSELVAGAINVSPPSASSDAAIIAIRPKTMRLKTMVDSAPVGVISSQVQTGGLQSDEAKQFLPTRLASIHCLKPRSQMEMNQAKSSKLKIQNLAKNQRSLPPTNSGDRLSYDGYNWRKYGQKQVKGSECPRSYYKCTHPNCLVKKKVEKSVDGKIAEIVYAGEHIHPRTQLLLKHLPSEAQEGYKFNETREETGIPLSNILLNEGSEGGVEDQNEVDLLIDPTCPGKALIPHEPSTTRISNKGVRIPNIPSGPGGDCKDGSRRADAEDDQPECKRSRNDGQSKKASITRQGKREPCVMVQNSKDSELLRDGFRWQKYGQKVVKGNPYPRSYYRCTNLMCNMRKHVERAQDDPTAFITTYEGKHNHDLPGTERLNPVASDSDSLLAPSKQNQAI